MVGGHWSLCGVTCCIVESRTGAIANIVSGPRSSNRTCGFPASGFPTSFTARSRKPATLQAPQTENSQRSEDVLNRKAACTSRRYFVAPTQKLTYALTNVAIHRLICARSSAAAKVVRPASKHAIQSVSHNRPRTHLMRAKQVIHCKLQACDASLGWTGAQIP